MADSYLPYKKPGTKSKYTEFEIKELLKCSVDPFYFIENYVEVQHPTEGLMKFIPYDYQRDIINTMHNYRSSIIMCGRQLGKTTSTASYLLWFCMFSSDKTVLIVGNTMETAKEILSRIKLSYEKLPDWLRDSAPEYAKTSVKFSNGSKIVCRATTKSSANGLSVSILYVDEFSKVPPRLQAEFWSSVKPTLSTGGKAIITSTPDHDEDVFAQIWKGAEDVIDSEGNVTDIGANGFKSYKAIWSAHPDRDEAWAEEERKAMGEEKFRREHCAEFISADETLINPLVLARLKSRQPEYTVGSVRFYKDILPNNTYIVSLDPSSGADKDAASIQIFEMPSMIQVGEWSHNKTPPREQIRILMNILKFIKLKMANLGGSGDSDVEPNLFWSFENNGVGESIISLIFEIGEENFPGTLVNEPKLMGHIKKVRRGLNTTNKNKVAACLKMKTYIDVDRMIVNSPGLIYQLKNFVAKGVGFGGKSDINDDLVMATVIAIRIMMLVENWGAFDPDVLRESIDEDDSEEPPLPMIFIR